MGPIPSAGAEMGEQDPSGELPVGGAPDVPARPTSSSGGGSRVRATANRLIRLADDVELFQTPEGSAMGTFPVGAHLETWELSSRKFRGWLANRFHTAEKSSPSGPALQEAIEVLEGKALHEGARIPVHIRLAELDGRIYLDLANDAWECVEISPSGWSLAPAPPVRFRRSGTLLRLPRPEGGGTAEELFRFINVPNPDDRVLVTAWLVAVLRPRGPYPILLLHGEQGSAKSTTARILGSVIDPSRAGLRAEPRSVHDLMIAAHNSHVIALDNLSSLPNWMSDALCRVSSGGSFAARKLYSDLEETFLTAQRPVILNGIEVPITRADLLDRTIVIELPHISEASRRVEAELFAEFELARPRILGALLDAISAALRNLNLTKRAHLPRMADFALWVSAAEGCLGLEEGEFIDIYRRNLASANDLALESSPVATAILLFVRGKVEWTGSCSDLMRELVELEAQGGANPRGLPTSARAMRSALERSVPSLRAEGVQVTFPPRSKSGRLVTLELLPGIPSRPSQSSSVSPAEPHLSPNGRSTAAYNGTIHDKHPRAHPDTHPATHPAIHPAIHPDALSSARRDMEETSAQNSVRNAVDPAASDGSPGADNTAADDSESAAGMTATVTATPANRSDDGGDDPVGRSQTSRQHAITLHEGDADAD